jgi:hypothetical protein
MKDDVNDEVPNGTPNILIPSNGVLTKQYSKKDHATHL